MIILFRYFKGTYMLAGTWLRGCFHTVTGHFAYETFRLLDSSPNGQFAY